ECASRPNQTQNSTKKQEDDRESYSPVGRGSCRAGASSTERPGDSLTAPNTLLPLPTKTSRLPGRAFTASARGSQRTSNPKCQNRRMQTNSALAFGVRELAPAFASTGSFESAGSPHEITGAGPGNAIGWNISW